MRDSEGVADMTAASTLDMSHREHVRRFRWQLAAVGGLTLASAGILAGATGLSSIVPLPTWSLGAGALFGLLVLALAGTRLLALRKNLGSGVVQEEPVKGEENPWVLISQAFEGWRTGKVPVLIPPLGADEREIAAFERGNEAFRILARRQRMVRVAIDKLREDLNTYHGYLTKSQVGLIGANSVAERLEDLDKRLAKIRAAM